MKFSHDGHLHVSVSGMICSVFPPARAVGAAATPCPAGQLAWCGRRTQVVTLSSIDWDRFKSSRGISNSLRRLRGVLMLPQTHLVDRMWEILGCSETGTRTVGVLTQRCGTLGR